MTDPVLKLARTLRLDDSDENIFDAPADEGEWAISGAFEFSNWDKSNLTGKPRQAFANGWLGLDSFGRASIVVVTPVSEAELETLADLLARHFVERYGAPDIAAARRVADDELEHMRSLCEDQADNTLLMVSRELEDLGVRERFRAIKPRDASLGQFAVHGDPH